MATQHQLSKEKMQELKAELQNLTQVRRKEVAVELEEARALGDLSENAEYHAAREEQAEVEARILELETILKTASVVHRHKSDKVIVGSVVEIQKKGVKVSAVYTIVDVNEVDLMNKKISANSPLGSEMMGKKVGDSFELKVGGKNKTTYQITALD